MENLNVLHEESKKENENERADRSKLQRITRNEMRGIVSLLENPKTVALFGDAKLTSVREKNGRGDYGVTETFSFEGRQIIQNSIDGARSDVWFTVDKEFFEALKKGELLKFKTEVAEGSRL